MNIQSHENAEGHIACRLEVCGTMPHHVIGPEDHVTLCSWKVTQDVSALLGMLFIRGIFRDGLDSFGKFVRGEGLDVQHQAKIMRNSSLTVVGLF